MIPDTSRRQLGTDIARASDVYGKPRTASREDYSQNKSAISSRVRESRERETASTISRLAADGPGGPGGPGAGGRGGRLGGDAPSRLGGDGRDHGDRDGGRGNHSGDHDRGHGGGYDRDGDRDHHHGHDRHDRHHHYDGHRHHGSNWRFSFSLDLHFGHVHGVGCGHYHYHNRWHDFPVTHVHYAGCGHYHVGGSWVSFSVGHVHGVGCGHYFDSGIWLSYTGSLHHHHAGCGHYYWGGLWHNHSYYHTHFDGCGHYYYDEYWHDFPAVHVHSVHCGHLYDGVRWYVVGNPAHVHGDGCGHYFYDGYWRYYPPPYYYRNRSQNFYFFVNLGDYESRNVPAPVQQYQARYESEPVNVLTAEDNLSAAYRSFDEGRYYRSLVEFNAAIDEAPDDGLLYFARAQVYIAVRDYRSAYADLIHGMELIPGWGDVQFNIAELYGNPDDFGTHFKDLESWVTEHPRDYQAHFVLGYVYYFLQDYELAKTELVYALAWEPQHPQAQALIEDIYEREAEAEFERQEAIASAAPASAAGLQENAGEPAPALSPDVAGQPLTPVTSEPVTIPKSPKANGATP